jgi:hypothetical protein
MTAVPVVPNHRAALDAAITFSLLLGCHWCRASEPGRWPASKLYVVHP